MNNALQSVAAGIGLSVLGMLAAAAGMLTPVQGAVLQEAIEGHKVVKLFGGQSYEAGRFAEQTENVRRSMMKQATAAAASVPMVQLLAGIALAEAVGPLDRIVALEIATSRRGFQRAGSEPEKWAPETRETADHSLPYLTARAMVDGDITAASFAPERIADPALRRFMQRITVVEDPVLTARTGGPGGAVPTSLTATLTDGQRVTREVDLAPGFPGRPMTREEVARKFLGNVAGHWPRERAEACLEAVWGLERAPNLGALLRVLA
jgi:2-methylcitrate dehydratase PrpD